MTYQVIARKYRPQRFDDVVGQDHVVKTLVNTIEKERIAHAYLFAGARGTGKTTVARIFAKCLNCENGPRIDFADDDPRCQEIAESRSLDVFEIDGASNRGIDEIRELRDTARYSPSVSRYKIYIIDEVHMLTKEAFNALLKTLEEPPEHVKFMFATTEPDKVLPTILSRTQRFDLRRIPTSLIVEHLRYIAEQERVEIGEAALQAIARGAEGGMRDAESALDQLISFCGHTIHEEEVLSMFGLTARSQIFELAGNILSGDKAGTLRQLSHLAEGGKDFGRLLGDLLSHFRNLLVYKVGNGNTELLEVTETEATTLAQQSEGLEAESVTRIMEVLTSTERSLRDAASKRILMEVSLLQALEARRAVSVDTVLERLQQLRGEVTEEGSPSRSPTDPAKSAQSQAEAPTAKSSQAGKPSQSAGQSKKTPSSGTSGKGASKANRGSTDSTPSAQDEKASNPAFDETTSPASTASGATGGNAVPNDLESLWHDLVAAAAKASPFLKTYLLEAHPVDFTQNTLTIGFDPEFSDHLGLVDNRKNHQLLKTKLKEMGYRDVRIKFVEAERPASFQSPTLSESEPGEAEGNKADESDDSTPAAAGNDHSQAPQAKKTKKESTKAAEPRKIDPEEFKNDPLIKQALEVFKGEIVEVWE